MSTENKIRCIRCKTFWIAISILVLLSFLVIGFAFLAFEFPKLSAEIFFQYFIYGLAFVSLIFFGLVSRYLIKEYCKEKERPDIFNLIIGCASAFFCVIAITAIVYYLPITLAENNIATLDQDARVQAVMDLDCKSFVNNIYLSSGKFGIQTRNYSYEIIYWDSVTEKDEKFELIYTDGLGTNQWLETKYLECEKK